MQRKTQTQTQTTNSRVLHALVLLKNATIFINAKPPVLTAIFKEAQLSMFRLGEWYETNIPALIGWPTENLHLTACHFERVAAAVGHPASMSCLWLERFLYHQRRKTASGVSRGAEITVVNAASRAHATAVLSQVHDLRLRDGRTSSTSTSDTASVADDDIIEVNDSALFTSVKDGAAKQRSLSAMESVRVGSRKAFYDIYPTVNGAGFPFGCTRSGQHNSGKLFSPHTSPDEWDAVSAYLMANDSIRLNQDPEGNFGNKDLDVGSPLFEEDTITQWMSENLGCWVYHFDALRLDQHPGIVYHSIVRTQRSCGTGDWTNNLSQSNGRVSCYVYTLHYSNPPARDGDDDDSGDEPFASNFLTFYGVIRDMILVCGSNSPPLRMVAIKWYAHCPPWMVMVGGKPHAGNYRQATQNLGVALAMPDGDDGDTDDEKRRKDSAKKKAVRDARAGIAAVENTRKVRVEGGFGAIRLDRPFVADGSQTWDDPSCIWGPAIAVAPINVDHHAGAAAIDRPLRYMLPVDANQCTETNIVGFEKGDDGGPSTKARRVPILT